MKRWILILILITHVAVGQASDPLEGKVVSVVDGNTLEIKSGNDTYKILLWGIDSPELTQDFGQEARKYLEKLTLKKEVKVQLQGKDRKGNRYGIVIIGLDIDPRVELLKEGLAWTTEKDPLPDLEPYRIFAQRKSRGLWKAKDPTPPWTYRRQQTMVQPKSS